MTRRWQAKDLSDAEMLDAIHECRLVHGYDRSATIWEMQAQLAHVPPKVVRAKLRSMVKRKVIEGCTCGCRGDFVALEYGAPMKAANADALKAARIEAEQYVLKVMRIDTDSNSIDLALEQVATPWTWAPHAMGMTPGVMIHIGAGPSVSKKAAEVARRKDGGEGDDQ